MPLPPAPKVLHPSFFTVTKKKEEAETEIIQNISDFLRKFLQIFDVFCHADLESPQNIPQWDCRLIGLNRISEFSIRLFDGLEVYIVSFDRHRKSDAEIFSEVVRKLEIYLRFPDEHMNRVKVPRTVAKGPNPPIDCLRTVLNPLHDCKTSSHFPDLSQVEFSLAFIRQLLIVHVLSLESLELVVTALLAGLHVFKSKRDASSLSEELRICQLFAILFNSIHNGVDVLPGTAIETAAESALPVTSVVRSSDVLRRCIVKEDDIPSLIQLVKEMFLVLQPSESKEKEKEKRFQPVIYMNASTAMMIWIVFQYYVESAELSESVSSATAGAAATEKEESSGARQIIKDALGKFRLCVRDETYSRSHCAFNKHFDHIEDPSLSPKKE